MWRPSCFSFLYKCCSLEQSYFFWHHSEECSLASGRQRDSLGTNLKISWKGDTHIFLPSCLLSEVPRNQEGVNFLNPHGVATSGSHQLWKQLTQCSCLGLPIPRQEANFNQYLWGAHHVALYRVINTWRHFYLLPSNNQSWQSLKPGFKNQTYLMKCLKVLNGKFQSLYF